MNTKFKRHQSVVLIRDPDPEYVEYHNEDDAEFKEIPIKKGMKGKVNVLLPNGKYHVEVFDSKGNILAYVPMNEEDLEAE
ncbi:hypothetical protein FJZ18_00340 [Candidatus Pacearchaeota archaeon]|nr:hypothetical protein [Candidatus Pacearchaeota archaeon]